MASLIDPYQASRHRIGDSNLLSLPLDCLGVSFRDPGTRNEGKWTITNIFALDDENPELGLRFRCENQHGLVSFFCQRDFEVAQALVREGYAIPWCPRVAYPTPLSARWVGLFVDALEDADDLHLRECALRLRRNTPSPIAEGTTLNRHLFSTDAHGSPVVEQQVLVCVGDCNSFGMGPDPSRKTVTSRWRLQYK